MGTRDAEVLLRDGLAVIDLALDTRLSNSMPPLFSGGHDSLCACYIAASHYRFNGTLNHIDTGIGSIATRKFVEMVCMEYGWNLKVWKSPITYELLVRRYGFPGPGGHRWAYSGLKERAIRQMMKQGKKQNRLLIVGCRQQESTRRMGHVQQISIGDRVRGELRNANRIWTSPCFDWSVEEQRHFMDVFGLPKNPVKDSILAMSGECFCGANAPPGEREMIGQVCPDVLKEIERLEVIARDAGKPGCIWGVRPLKDDGVVPTGPLCSSCDYRAAAAGIRLRGLFDDESDTKGDDA